MPGVHGGIYFGRQTLVSAGGVFLTLNPGIPGGPGGPGGHRAGHCKKQKHSLVYQVHRAHPGKLVSLLGRREKVMWVLALNLPNLIRSYHNVFTGISLWQEVLNRSSGPQ